MNVVDQNGIRIARVAGRPDIMPPDQPETLIEYNAQLVGNNPAGPTYSASEALAGSIRGFVLRMRVELCACGLGLLHERLFRVAALCLRVFSQPRGHDPKNGKAYPERRSLPDFDRNPVQTDVRSSPAWARCGCDRHHPAA